RAGERTIRGLPAPIANKGGMIMGVFAVRSFLLASLAVGTLAFLSSTVRGGDNVIVNVHGGGLGEGLAMAGQACGCEAKAGKAAGGLAQGREAGAQAGGKGV